MTSQCVTCNLSPWVLRKWKAPNQTTTQKCPIQLTATLVATASHKGVEAQVNQDKVTLQDLADMEANSRLTRNCLIKTAKTFKNFENFLMILELFHSHFQSGPRTAKRRR